MVKKIKQLLACALGLVILAGNCPVGKNCVQTVSPMMKVEANATNAYVNGYSPNQLRTAYGVNSLPKQGAGQTIAIVDAYGDPNIEQDLKTFDSTFSLNAPPSIHVAYPGGQPDYSNDSGGWALETALDVEWAHSMAPQANITVVAAKSAAFTDMFHAVDYANNNSAQIVSMSWGGRESSSESSRYDTYFSHPSTTYVASDGDNGAAASYPAASQKVVAVGGTTLKLDSTSHRRSETAWSGSGGDPSQYIQEPSWQKDMKISSNGKRGIPDVAFDADPATGVAVYSSVNYSGRSGWFEVGGTSLSAPAWAGLLAVGNSYSPNSNAGEKLYKLAGGTSYQNPQGVFYDVVSGSNGNSAKKGYDFVTGLGSPNAAKLLPLL